MVSLLDEYKLFVQRIGLVGITNILISLSSLILLPVLTKNLTTQNYGVWNLFNATFAFIPLIVNLGLPYTMVRFLAVKNDKNEIQEGFYTITLVLLIMGLITLFILLILSKQIAGLLFDGNTTVAGLLAVSILFGILSTSFFSYFRILQQMKLFSLLSLLQTYFGLVMVTFLVLSGHNISGAVTGYIIAQFITFILAFSLIVRQIGFKFPKFENLREYLSFGVPTVPGNLSSWMVNMSDQYVIGIVLGTAFVGYYSPGYALGNIITMLMAPFTFILPALLSSYYDRNQIWEVEKHLKYSLKYFMLLAIPSVLGLSLLSKSLLTLLTTTAIAQHGYLVTPFVALSALLLGVYGITSQVLALEKKTKIIGSLWMLAALINIVINIVFVPHYGIIAAAISTLIAYGFAFAVSLFYSVKYIKITFNFGFILKSLLASILMSSVIISIHHKTVVGILITIALSAIVYMIILILLKGISTKELKFFKKLIRG